ncbi:MAG TPA: helix-turn-helix domain-containing protein [Candidatus Deferrimicrobiaceae bacterium]
MAGGAGASWKAKREAMGKTLEQVAAELRVSRRYLAGIEEGDFRGWPERVFSSGFIRAYGKYLSEDPGTVLTEYERSVEEREEVGPSDTLRPEWLERERERGTRRTSYTLAAGVVLLVGLVLAWVSLRNANRPPPPSPVASAPAVTPPAENAAKMADNAATTPPGSDNATPVTGAVASLPVPAGPAPSPTVASVGGSGPLAGPFQLFLEASEQTWLMYSFDDGDPIDVTLYPGDKISIQAQRRIGLKLGNAGGVAGTLNGRRLPPFGERGQVRKVAFGQ